MILIYIYIEYRNLKFIRNAKLKTPFLRMKIDIPPHAQTTEVSSMRICV